MLYVWVEETIGILVSTRIYGCIRHREFITAAISEVDAFGSRISGQKLHHRVWQICFLYFFLLILQSK